MVSERQVIEIGLTKLRRYVHKLRAASENDGRSDDEIAESVEQVFRRLVVLATNLAHHTIGRLRLATPGDPLEIFAVLGRAGVLPVELAERLHGVAMLRRRLAHGYQEIPSGEIPAWVPHRLDDFAALATCLEDILMKESGP